MRRAGWLAALALLSGCEDEPSAPAPESEPAPAAPAEGAAAEVQPPAGQASRGIGTTSGLSAHTSSLTGAVSDFAMERTDFGTRVQLAADTLFEFDKAALTPAAETNLERAAELVRQGGRGTVTIVGHTDSKGDAGYNLALSRRRAEAVASWLRARPDLNGRAFAVEGRGEAEPIAPNEAADGADDPRGRARNRRVTIDIPR